MPNGPFDAFGNLPPVNPACAYRNGDGDPCRTYGDHVHCCQCGSASASGTGICPYHGAAFPEGWADENRILCDLIHRRIEPARLAIEQRESDWTPG